MVISVEDAIAKFLGERINAGDFPSAVYLVAEAGEIVIHGAIGHAVIEPESILAANDTIYDLASLTKVLCTVPIVARLIQTGDLALEGLVSAILPEFRVEDKRDITIQQMLSHTSRLPAWKPLYLTASSPEDVLNDVARTPLIDRGNRVTYSDLNFITLGKITERILGVSLDDTFHSLIGRPLELRDTIFNPDPTLRSRLAASETGNRHERQMCIEMGYIANLSSDSVSDDIFRNDVIWGRVHDGNACFMRGVAGHAGLFSTAGEVLRIANQFLPDRSELFSTEICELFRTNMTPDANEHRSFGFQLASTTDSTAGVNMPPQSFGHLGFTGTSLWIDPVNERVFILLTNRTHHHSLPFVLINSVRRKFHDLAIEFLDKNR